MTGWSLKYLWPKMEVFEAINLGKVVTDTRRQPATLGWTAAIAGITRDGCAI